MTKSYGLYINGAFVPGEGLERVEVTDRRGTGVATLVRATPREAQQAKAAARAAFGAWMSRAAHERGGVLGSVAAAMDTSRDALVEAVRTTGATPVGARKEVDAAIALAEGLAGWADKHAVMLGSRNPVAGPYYCFTTPEPLGVVVVAAPQRAALLELVTLSTAILSAGNTMVVLAEGGRALPAIVYAACCVAAGMPSGVVNVLSGERAALLEAIVARGGVDGIAAVAPGAEEEAALRRAAVMTGTPVALLPEDETDGSAEAGGSGLLELIDAFVKTKTVWHPSAL